MTWYQPVPVAPDLVDALVCRWTAQTEGHHVLVPDGCMDVLWLDDGRLILCGPETSAWAFMLPSGTQAVGVRFRPGRAARVLGVPAHETVDRRVGIDQLLGSREARRLSARICDAATLQARASALEAAARGWVVSADDADDPFAARMTSALGRGSKSIAEVADAFGLTERQLQRRSLATFGYPPSTLRGILRLQRFMALARSALGRSADLATLAHMAGYTDQAHLSHESRRLAGMTPRQLLNTSAPDWHGDADVVVPRLAMAERVPSRDAA